MFPKNDIHSPFYFLDEIQALFLKKNKFIRHCINSMKRVAAICMYTNPYVTAVTQLLFTYLWHLMWK